MTTRCWACEATRANDAAFCPACGATGTATVDPTPETLIADVSTTSVVDTRPRANRWVGLAVLAAMGLVIWLLVAGGDDDATPDDAAPSTTSSVAPQATNAPATTSSIAPGLLARSERPEAFEPYPDAAGTTLVAHTEQAVVIVDLGSGQVSEFPFAEEGANFNGTPTVVGVGNDVVAARGRSAVWLSISDGTVVELGEASVVAAADPALNGGSPAVWLGQFQTDPADTFASATTWTLVDREGSPLRTVRLNQLLQLPKLGPEVIWEPGGGMYALAGGEDYRQINPGFPYAYSDAGVLIETCDEARVCASQWFDRRGEPQNLPVPDRQFSFPASASEDGRFYYSSDSLGRLYDVTSGADRSIFCGQHSWSPVDSLFACMNATSLDVLDLAGTETMRYQFGEPLIGVALLPTQN